jgi:hypothetical protein
MMIPISMLYFAACTSLLPAKPTSICTSDTSSAQNTHLVLHRLLNSFPLASRSLLINIYQSRRFHQASDQPMPLSPAHSPSSSLLSALFSPLSFSIVCSISSSMGLDSRVAPVSFRFLLTSASPFALAFSYFRLPLIYWRRICPVAQSSSNLARYGSASLAYLMLVNNSFLAFELTASISFDSLVIDWSLYLRPGSMPALIARARTDACNHV